MRNGQQGFTLIELVMVLIIVGLLAAMAVPRFVDQSDAALRAAKKGMSGAVKSALTIYIADQRTYPNLTQLASYVQGEGVRAQPDAGGATGVEVTIDEVVYVVPTHTNPTCTAPTAAGTDIVQCVGSISHP